MTADLVIGSGQPLEDFEPKDLLIRGGVIDSVQPPGTMTAERTLDATGCLVMPGFAEAHCHLDKTLFGRPGVSHLAGDSLAQRISHDRERRVELGLPDPEAMRLLVDAMARAGTTTLRTHTDVDPDVGLACAARPPRPALRCNQGR